MMKFVMHIEICNVEIFSVLKSVMHVENYVEN